MYITLKHDCLQGYAGQVYMVSDNHGALMIARGLAHGPTAPKTTEKPEAAHTVCPLEEKSQAGRFDRLRKNAELATRSGM